MSVVSVSQQYSNAFENAVAEYTCGVETDRGAKTEYELSKKAFFAQQFFEFCRRYFDLSGRRFLEVGCGTGSVSVAAAAMGARVSATDLVEKALGLAQMRWREHGVDGELFRSDLRADVPKSRRSAFDVVFCYQVLEHLPRADQFKALGNLFAMVAPSGHLFIDTENSLCPFDRHDSQTWLLRLLTKTAYEPLLEKLGRELNFFEPSAGARVRTHDYLSYDELIGAALVSGFEVVDPFMPHGDKRQALRSLTGGDWLHDFVVKDIDVERFMPISLLLRKR